jgi:hypothetical protein
VRDLGVDAVWVSATCPAPMADFGYDVGLLLHRSAGASIK